MTLTQGTRVKFVDTPNGAGDIAHGTVSGPPVETSRGIYVPVWVDARPGGREGTNIWVHIDNVVAVTTEATTYGRRQ